MAKKRPIFASRRLVLLGCGLAGATLTVALGIWLGADRAVTERLAERAALAKGMAEAAAIERKEAAAASAAPSEAASRAVTIAELFNAYKADPAAAQRRYEGQKLEVAGKVARPGQPGEPMIAFASPEGGKTVQAMIAPEDTDLVPLAKPGAQISVLCSGIAPAGAVPVLTDCRF